MGKRIHYFDPDTKETIWCERGKQPENWVQIPHFKKVEELEKTISKEELFTYYIIENHDFHNTAQHFNIDPEGILHSLLKWYNIKKSQKLSSSYRKTTGRSHENYVEAGKKSGETQKKHWEEKSDEDKRSWSKKQKEAHNTEHFKQTISDINKEYHKNMSDEDKKEYSKKRSVASKKMWEDPDHIIKVRTTYKKNRKDRLCRTKAEQALYDNFITIYPDLINDELIDERYPFYCDFYIPSLDVFIELNAHPSHGNKPYSGNIEECYNLRDKWLETFTKRDPEKLQTAKANNLNYIMIYPSSSLKDNYKINNNKFKDIIKLAYNSQK